MAFQSLTFLCSYLSKGVFVFISVLIGYSLFALSAKGKKYEDVSDQMFKLLIPAAHKIHKP